MLFLACLAALALRSILRFRQAKVIREWNLVDADNAETALRAYVERPKSEPADLAKHRRLEKELDVAMHEFLRLLSSLGQ